MTSPTASTPPPLFAPLFTLQQLLAIIKAHRWVVALSIILCVIVIAALTLVTPRSWMATADIYVDYREGDLVTGRNFSAMLDDSYLQTQIDMIRSQAVALDVIQKRGLRSTAAYREALQDRGEAYALDKLIESITKNTTVSKGQNSRVLTVGFEAKSPEEAQAMTNAIVQSYLDVTLNIASSSAKSLQEQYSAQLETLRNEANAIEASITRYRQEHQLLGVIGETDHASLLLTDLRQELRSLQTRTIEAETRLQSIQRQLSQGMRAEDLAELALSTTLNDQKSKLTESTRLVNESRATLGINHPTLQGLQAQQTAIQHNIARTAQSLLTDIRNAPQTLRAQQQLIEKRIREQEARVLEQLQHQDRLHALARQRASVDQVYQAALQKYDNLLMASSVNAPNLTVLKRAEVPSAPSRPKPLLNLLAALVVGTLIGLALTVILEFRNRRVRCLDDLLQHSNTRFLGHFNSKTQPLRQGATS